MPEFKACGADPLPKEDYLADGYDDGRHDIKAIVVERFTRDGVAWERRKCKECCGVFECEAISRRAFGSDKHRMAFLQRRQRRGLMIINDALRMRKSHNGKRDPKALADMCAKISLMLDQDKRAGRPSW